MTFKEARKIWLGVLEQEKWDVHTLNRHSGQPLKVPYAISPDKRVTLWFKTQAVYISRGHDFGNALSLLSDMRSNIVFQIERLVGYLDEAGR